MGLAVGNDLAVTSFDAIPNAFDVEPPLTSVELPLERSAYEVARLVLRQIEGEPPPEPWMMLPHSTGTRWQRPKTSPERARADDGW